MDIERNFFYIILFKIQACSDLLLNILRKTIEGYLNSFYFIAFEKIIFKQSNFISNRTITMQLSKMQNEIYGSLITLQYHTKCTDPLYPKFTSNKFSAYIFCCNLYLVNAYVLIPTTDKFLLPLISHWP